MTSPPPSNRPRLRILPTTALILTVTLCPAAFADTGPEPAVGLWFTQEHKAAIEVSHCGPALCGRIAWIDESHPPPDASGPPIDRRNPDPALRTRPLCGLEILRGFEAAGNGTWTGGSIYDPKQGQTWRAQMTSEGPDTLRLRGYLLVPVFGQSQVWTRAPAGAVTPCRADRPAPLPPGAPGGEASARSVP